MEIYSKAVASIESTDDDKFGPNGGFTAVLSTPSLDRDGDRLMRDEWKEFTQARYPLDIDHGMTVADTVGSFAPYWDGDRMMMDAHFAGTAKAQDVRALVQPDPVTGIRHIGSVSVAFMTDKSKKSGEPQRELLNAGIVAIPSNRDAVILASKAANALKDAFSDSIEGEVPDEVKQAVLDVLDVKAPEEVSDVDTKEGELTPVKTGSVYIDVLPRFDSDGFKTLITEVLTKASATASGAGTGGALVQAIHDASSHLGAACPVMEPEVDPDTGASSGANKSVKAADVRGAVAGLDAIIDEAVKLSAGINREGLPEEVGQALDLLVGAQKSVADIMEQLGVFDPDNPDGKSVGFTDQTGQRIEFDSHSDAREFFTRMLASLDSAETSEVELVEVIVTDDLEAFEKALDQALTPEDSPANEAAAPSDEERAPADKAADEKAKRARQLQLMQMRATTPFNFIEGTN